jgi:hypothetical protein
MNSWLQGELFVQYRKGYKYQLATDEIFLTNIHPKEDIITTRICLYMCGTLVVGEGYAYDGPSGPVVDRKTNMRGAAGHDALYQLMRMELLSHTYWRAADHCFGGWIKEDGAWNITVKVDLLGLKLAGGSAALPKNRKKVYTAP